MPRKKPAHLELPIRSSNSTTPPSPPRNIGMPSATDGTLPTPCATPKPYQSLTLWQARSLTEAPDRTPLPAEPNSRPWKTMTPFHLKRAIRRVKEAHKIKTNDDEKTKKQGAEKATVSRKVWKKDEIEQLASMREAGASWTKIHEIFPWRTMEGLKQVWWKYKYRTQKLSALSGNSSGKKSEMDMDVESDGFGRDGKVKWNFRRKS